MQVGPWETDRATPQEDNKEVDLAYLIPIHSSME